MLTPTVTESIISLEATTRDDFADSPAIAPAGREPRRPHRVVPEARREPARWGRR